MKSTFSCKANNDAVSPGRKLTSLARHIPKMAHSASMENALERCVLLFCLRRFFSGCCKGAQWVKGGTVPEPCRTPSGGGIHVVGFLSECLSTCEISLSGLSAATTGILRPGEEVRLSPLVGDQVSAIVRRKIGTIYGFEFVSVPPRVQEDLHILCAGLAPFRGLSEVQGS
jgi:hypothetical protein